MKWLGKINRAWLKVKRERATRKAVGRLVPASPRLALFDIYDNMVGEPQPVEFTPAGHGTIVNITGITLGPVGAEPISSIRILDESGNALWVRPLLHSMREGDQLHWSPGMFDLNVD